MDPKFSLHNTHLENAKQFAYLDPHLRRLDQQKYIYESPILKGLPLSTPGIYTLSGGRQIGKTTLMKQWMLKLLGHGINPPDIVFFSGELIDDHHVLFRLLNEQFRSFSTDQLHYLLLDEVTYIKDWDKAIKYAADSGLFENTIVLISGSDLALIRDARMRFPGRRGKSSKIDFHLYPLSFKETIEVKRPKLYTSITDTLSSHAITSLYQELNNYLIHGGYLTAINDLFFNHQISNSTLLTYADWIRGDILKQGKKEHYLSEILTAIIKRYHSQISWNSLSKDLSIDHHQTVADYAYSLVSMDALFVQSALREDKLTAAPKKAHKLMFTDPFIFHAIRSWLWPTARPYQDQILPALLDPELSSKLIETCVINHYQRLYPTYYIKAEGEVDIAYVDGERFWPVEIKWTNQIRAKDLKQILKYPNGKILTKSSERGQISGIETIPVPVALFDLPAP